MRQTLLDCVTLAATVRSAWLIIGLARMIPVHAKARIRRWGVEEVLAFLELPVFLALTGFLLFSPPPTPPSGTATLFLAAVGALLAVAGVSISIWAIYTTMRQRVILDGGHFVKERHPLVTTGAYAFVRNPMYLGIILIWLGLASAFQSLVLLAAAVLYVVPVFWLYTRAEERMMSQAFGAQFDDYSRAVGRLLPRLHAGGRGEDPS